MIKKEKIVDKKVSKKDTKKEKVKKEKVVKEKTIKKSDVVKYVDNVESNKVLDINFQGKVGVFNGSTSKITIDEKGEVKTNYVRVDDGSFKEPIKTTLTVSSVTRDVDIASPGYIVSNWQDKTKNSEGSSEGVKPIFEGVKPIFEGVNSTADINTNYGYLTIHPPKSPTNLDYYSLEELSIIKSRLVEIISVARGDNSQYQLLMSTNNKVNKINEELDNRINKISW